MNNTQEKISIVEQTTDVASKIIEEKKPKVVNGKANLLEGYMANSWNGGIIRPVFYKKIMAGEKIRGMYLNGFIRMLTPKAPVGQKLTTTFLTFFVPNSRVWNNAEKYMAQKGGETIEKIEYIPHISGQKMPMVVMNSYYGTPITNTTLWRDSYVSGYLPRIAQKYVSDLRYDNLSQMPNVSVLPLRGFKAIYNDYLRHKVYDEEMYEYKDDEVSDAEYISYFPKLSTNSQVDERENFRDSWKSVVKRARRKDSYYTNYRTQAEGIDLTIDPMYQDLMNHNEWQKKVAESRAQASNENLTDFEIIAKIRGSKLLTEGKVQYLTKRDVGMNYVQVAQTSYNTNNDISEEYQSLGQTGAFSYTEVKNLPLLTYHEFKEDGYLHIIAITQSDTIFETGIDRQLLNIRFDDEYRPDLKELTEDTLTKIEVSNVGSDLNDRTIIGFKRKFSEYFKLPNCINGDMTTSDILDITCQDTGSPTADIPVPKKNMYQFFEIANDVVFGSEEQLTMDNEFSKNIWQDYTDLLINKNQAVENEVDYFDAYPDGTIRVRGANQIFAMGVVQCVTEQPIDDNIKSNYLTWGEE